MSMRTSDFLWLAIRGCGILFLVKAVCTLPPMAAAVFTLSSSLNPPTPDSANIWGGAMGMMRQASATSLVVSAVELVFYGVIGLYLCKKGGWFFRFIKPPEEPAPEKGEPGA